MTCTQNHQVLPFWQMSAKWIDINSHSCIMTEMTNNTYRLFLRQAFASAHVINIFCESTATLNSPRHLFYAVAEYLNL